MDVVLALRARGLVTQMSMGTYIDQILECYHCGCSLDELYDYSCPVCGHEVCDKDSQACQEGSCDTILCFACVDCHWRVCHEDVRAVV